jgi:hypothetical protein
MNDTALSTALGTLRKRLAQNVAEAEKLRAAIDALESFDQPVAARKSNRKSSPKLLPAPGKTSSPTTGKKPLKRPGEGDREFEVGKGTITLPDRQARAMDLLAAADEGVCVSQDAFITIFGSAAAMFAALREMRDKLNKVGATIGNVRGAGYRLETL